MERLTNRDTKLSKANVTYRNAIDKLAEYEDLEEQGLLLRLPCKCEDTVWSIEEDKRKIRKCTVRNIEFSNHNSFALLEKDIMYSENRGYIRVPLGNFGRNVFLTKEQAEDALKKMEGENETD